MMYCQNCGAKIEDNVNICPFCGFSNEGDNEFTQKDRKIQELQEKITELEQTVSNTTVNENDRGFNNKMMFAFIFILPIAFLVFFFVLFFILANR
jgi:uncharacterized membrane protein YvbJ